jgi:hypothetical protein
MKQLLRFLLLVLLMASTFSCRHQKQVSSASHSSSKPVELYTGGDGTSQQNTVIVNESVDSKGVAAEYAWLKQQYPGYQLVSQKVVYANDGHPYDRIEIKTAEGETKIAWFDIAGFYGKF